jgi:hypothetical protein
VSAAEVAAALMAHPRFVWAPGMLTGATRIDAVDERGQPYRIESRPVEWPGDPPVAHCYPRRAPPNLSDPATAGVLLGMLVAYRGGMFDRAMESIEDTDEHGRSSEALIDVYGLGFMCARALLVCWSAA